MFQKIMFKYGKLRCTKQLTKYVRIAFNMASSSFSPTHKKKLSLVPISQGTTTPIQSKTIRITLPCSSIALNTTFDGYPISKNRSLILLPELLDWTRKKIKYIDINIVSQTNIQCQGTRKYTSITLFSHLISTYETS